MYLLWTISQRVRYIFFSSYRYPLSKFIPGLQIMLAGVAYRKWTTCLPVICTIHILLLLLTLIAQIRTLSDAYVITTAYGIASAAYISATAAYVNASTTIHHHHNHHCSHIVVTMLLPLLCH